MVSEQSDNRDLGPTDDKIMKVLLQAANDATEIMYRVLKQNKKLKRQIDRLHEHDADFCPLCHLEDENARLQNEITRLKNRLAKVTRRPLKEAEKHWGENND